MAVLKTSSDPAASRLGGLLQEAVDSYAAVNDYRAVFSKQEGSDPKETIFLKFEKPFKIFMHWSDTHKKGLQVLYERGRHDGKLAIHKPGLLLGLAPVVFLEQDSPWVREGSQSYDIEDAGIGTFLFDFSEMTLKGISEGKFRASFTENEKGVMADVSFPQSEEDEIYFASRAEVLFDPRTKLPVYMKLYDWQDKTSGVYEYGELELNIGPDDSEFRKVAHRRLLKLYLPPVKITKTTNFSSR